MKELWEGFNPFSVLQRTGMFITRQGLVLMPHASPKPCSFYRLLSGGGRGGVNPQATAPEPPASCSAAPGSCRDPQVRPRESST